MAIPRQKPPKTRYEKPPKVVHAEKPPKTTHADLVLGGEDTSLLDVVDNALNKGIVLNGDITLALANVDLVYARLALLLCAADRVLPHEDETNLIERRRARRAARLKAAGGQGSGA